MKTSVRVLQVAAFVASILSSTVSAQTPHPEKRGLLASLTFEGQPLKATYFFAGEGDNSNPLYTSHPTLPDDLTWNSVPASRGRVMARISAAHVNTVVMSYWSNMPSFSPMQLIVQNGLTQPGVPEAVDNLPLVVMPAIEGGFDPNRPQNPHWQFQDDFPHVPNGTALAPGLVQRIGQVVGLFRTRMNRWAQIYDLNGEPRYAINIIHACSDVPGVDDAAFARGFGAVAAQIENTYHIKVGFTLDTVGATCKYLAFPKKAGPFLKNQPAVLAVMGFESEVFSGKLVPGNNNVSNLPNLADWKKAALADWVATGVPVILDVSNGYDARIVFANPGASYWGDNMDSKNGTDDRWRNWTSELKNTAIKGIVMDTWNGYTEGYAAVPTREHGMTVYNWLRDLMEPDPRTCSHMHYVNGLATYRVYGAICEKWVQLGADRGFGRPESNEQPSALGRVSNFENGSAIYWSGTTGSHEVHGLIAKAYLAAGADHSCLGLPTSDEQPNGSGRINNFQHGTITWKPGDAAAAIHCR